MKQVYMDTYGCQMNVADSDRMELLLFQNGYERTLHKEMADLILVNTCSVREKAEQKVYSLFGHLGPLKRENPDLLFGLTGCLAQQEGQKLARRMPDLDFILGPDMIDNLPEAIARARSERQTVVWTDFDSAKNYSIPVFDENADPIAGGPSAFVNIIKGCDKFCSFCIVPLTRGREKSREADEICREVRQRVDRGAREVILLGQNVNAYGKRGLNDPVAFHELLYRIAEIDGLRRLRFTTSYPGDFNHETIRAFRDIPILMNHLHLPVQSGNDRILELMRRGHTHEEYLNWMAALKAEVPDIAVSSDIIVGFPGETDAEFEDTLSLMEAVGFHNNYMFAYSPRPGTPAEAFPDTVPPEVKKERLQRTIDLQNRLTEQAGQQYLGKQVEVLIESVSHRNGADFKGRTPHYWMVNFSGGAERCQPGDIVPVEVDEVRGHVLLGRLATGG